VLPAKPDAAFPQRTGVSRPIVALLLEKDDKQMIVFALVDSGADSCVFPASVAETLGIPIPNQSVSVFSGSSDKPQIAYYEQIQASILPMDSPGIEPNQPSLTFPLFAGFCDTLEHVGMGLLGQEGFFSRFGIHFHASQDYFEIL
jgi:hypothetical protein